jgi:hypothetical protein
MGEVVAQNNDINPRRKTYTKIGKWYNVLLQGYAINSALLLAWNALTASILIPTHLISILLAISCYAA